MAATTREVKISIRAKREERDFIDLAADVLGKNRSEFMLESAYEKAREVLLDQRLFYLSDEQYQQFLEILDRPPTRHEKLHKLLHSKSPWD
jgi:uncharacterized protein (DUF1778 family)